MIMQFKKWVTLLNLIFTAHKRSLGQGNIFRSVCHEFCPQGGRGEYLGRYNPPGPGTLPGASTPPGPGTPPLGQVHPPGQVQPPLGPGTPPGQVHPWDKVHPPEQCMLGDTGNKRAVRILLECILVKRVTTTW